MKFLQYLLCFVAPPTLTENSRRKVNSREDGSVVGASAPLRFSCGPGNFQNGYYDNCAGIAPLASISSIAALEGDGRPCAKGHIRNVGGTDKPIMQYVRRFAGVNEILSELRHFDCTGRILQPNFHGSVHFYTAMQRDGTPVQVKLQVSDDVWVGPSRISLDLLVRSKRSPSRLARHIHSQNWESLEKLGPQCPTLMN